MTLRLLMFGRTGQVAREVAERAGPDIAVTALDRGAADLADPAACAEVIASAAASGSVDVVLNAAAWTAVDAAEGAEAEATVVNAAAPGAMAAAAARYGLPFLHISTDYVFDGRPGRAWREEDAPAPLNAYGRSKLAGERAVLDAGAMAVVVRSSWIHSAHGRNFVLGMLGAAAVRDELRVVDDQVGGPTSAGDLADALLAIARAWHAGRGVPGLFHYAGAPVVSWCGFAREVFTRAGLARPPRVVPITSDEWRTPAPRPANSVLDCGRIARAYGLAQPDWRVSLDGILADLREAERPELGG